MKLCKPPPPAIHPIQRLRHLLPAAAAALLMAMPTWEGTGNDSNSERQQVAHAADAPGVILWDETGNVRPTSLTQATGSGSEQAVSDGHGISAAAFVSGALTGLPPR